MISKRCLCEAYRFIDPIAYLITKYLDVTPPASLFIDNKGYSAQFTRIDHITPRTKLELYEKAKIFTIRGYRRECTYEYPKDGWYAHAYALAGNPVLFIDRAYPFDGPHSEAARKNPIPGWIDEFPEDDREDFLLHHIACRVDNIDRVMEDMRKDGMDFGNVLSGYNGKLLQVFTKPVMLMGAKSKKPVAGTVFELIYRDPSLNDWDFIKEQASELMMKQSTGGA